MRARKNITCRMKIVPKGNITKWNVPGGGEECILRIFSAMATVESNVGVAGGRRWPAEECNGGLKFGWREYVAENKVSVT